MSKNKVTIQDIANAVGVSKTTVSRYLNGKYSYMSEETRKKIEDAIAATNFRPNKFAKSLKTARSELIGLIIPEATSTMTPYLISSVCDTCASYGRKVILVSTNNDPDKERIFIQNLVEQQVDGIITATGSNLPIYEKINASVCPVVLMDRIEAPSSLDFVAIDHAQGISKVLHSLLEKGFQKILFLLRESKNEQGTFSIREECARKICREYIKQPIYFEKQLIPDAQINEMGIFDSLLHQNYPSNNQAATALFIADERLTIPIISNFFRLGMEFSDFFSIVCYDTMHFSSSISNCIATIEQPLNKMGALATEILIQKIDGNNETEEPLQKYIRCITTLPPEI